MGRLKRLLAGFALTVACAAAAMADGTRARRTVANGSSGAGAGQWISHIEEASVRFGIPAEWISRVIRAESGGRTTAAGKPITSPAGAMGLMQLMPGTWSEMRLLHRLGPDPHDPRDNILAGTAYLRAMYDRFGYPGLFAAYNAGPERYARHLSLGKALPAETIAYVAALSSTPRRLASQVEPRGAGLFVPLAAQSRDEAPPAASADMLFARLRTRSSRSE